jgi:hypothetical protein
MPDRKKLLSMAHDLPPYTALHEAEIGGDHVASAIKRNVPFLEFLWV